MLLAWEPIFEDDAEKAGKIVRVRFIMLDSKNKIDYVMETGSDFDSLLRAVDVLTDKYGQTFSTMIDTGAITLAETVQCSVDGVMGIEAWKKQKVYLQEWSEQQFWTNDEY